jgi:competence protein ComEA
MMKLFSTITLFAAYLLVCAGAMAGPVDINTADADSLARAIDGVGERKARAIIEYRRNHGPFGNVNELAAVKGIGMSTVERNRDNLTVVKPSH